MVLNSELKGSLVIVAMQWLGAQPWSYLILRLISGQDLGKYDLAISLVYS